MNTVDISSDNIRQENGEMVAFWPVFITSQSLHRFGEQMEREGKATIPPEFAAIVEDAKAQNRSIRITYLGILGPQKALNVQLL